MNTTKIWLIGMLALTLQEAVSQVYLKGEAVIPFSEAASSSYLVSDRRLESDTVFQRLKEVYPEYMRAHNPTMPGESWWIDGMLVQIVTRRIGSIHKENLKATMYSMRPYVSSPIIQGVRIPGDSSRVKDYYDTLKVVNNFEVLIRYYKTLNQDKRFIIQDLGGKYEVLGAIYCRKEDMEKAHGFIEILLESITFKD